MSSPSRRYLTLMNANLHEGGQLDPDGRPSPTHLANVASLVRDVEPHILTTQHGAGWGEKRWLVAEAEHAFGPHFRAEVAPSEKGAHTATFFDQRMFRWTDFETKYSGETFHGFGVLKLRLIERPDLHLNVISAHLHPSSAEAAAAEAQTMAWRVRRREHDLFGVLAGRINYFPSGDPEPDWFAPEITDFNRMARTVDTPDGPRANPLVASRLRAGGLIDAAAQVADAEDDPSLRADTGRARVRVDQFHVTAALAQGIVGYERIPIPGSKKKVIVLTIDPSKLNVPPRNTP